MANRRGSRRYIYIYIYIYIYEALFQTRHVAIKLFSLMTYLTMSTALKLKHRKLGLWASRNFEVILIKFDIHVSVHYDIIY